MTLSRDWPRSLLISLSILAWLAVALGALWLLDHVARTILLLGIAVIIAVALNPLVPGGADRSGRGYATSG